MKHFLIIALVGPTGIGKTKLGVELARHLNGEVISLDSLQVYRDGGIMTAKPTAEEMDGIKHHLISYLAPDKELEPSDFVNLIMETIQTIHDKKKVPILIGGSTSLTKPVLLHQFMRNQKLGVIMLDCKLLDLAPRLEARVDQMVGDGLLKELQSLYQQERALLIGRDPKFQQGVWKAIGYQELRPCLELEASHAAYLYSKTEGIARMKENTKKYAAAQLDWLWSDLVPSFLEEQVEFMVLRMDNISTFEEKAIRPAMEQCHEWLAETFQSDE